VTGSRAGPVDECGPGRLPRSSVAEGGSGTVRSWSPTAVVASGVGPAPGVGPVGAGDACAARGRRRSSVIAVPAELSGLVAVARVGNDGARTRSAAVAAAAAAAGVGGTGAPGDGDGRAGGLHLLGLGDRGSRLRFGRGRHGGGGGGRCRDRDSGCGFGGKR